MYVNTADTNAQNRQPAMTLPGIDFAAPRFIKSALSLNGCPPDCGAEVAFVGRSNAGKSSTLNALTNRRRLAYTGRTPGCTRTLNFFALGHNNYRLVDLPGYGYAQASKSQRYARWELTKRFMRTRRSLCGIFLITDARHPMHDSDWDFLALAHDVGVQIHVLLNRADQLAFGARKQILRQTQLQCVQLSSNLLGDVQLFSATRKIGIAEVRTRIIELMGR